jgi:formylglycine-generating enzyme required for sulfatase activity
MKYRVLRGGSYFNVIWYLRSTFRDRSGPEVRDGCDGFRLVLQPLLKQQRRKT